MQKEENLLSQIGRKNKRMMSSGNHKTTTSPECLNENGLGQEGEMNILLHRPRYIGRDMVKVKKVEMRRYKHLKRDGRIHVSLKRRKYMSVFLSCT